VPGDEAVVELSRLAVVPQELRQPGGSKMVHGRGRC
jgi:hypothetical protein